MSKIIAYLKARKPGFYITIASVAFLLAFAILYPKNGTNEFVVELSTSLIALIWATFALALLSLVIEVKLLRSCVYLLSLYALIAFIGTQGNYLANVLVSIDGNSFSSGFIVTVVFAALASISAFVAIFFTPEWNPWKHHEGISEQKGEKTC